MRLAKSAAPDCHPREASLAQGSTTKDAQAKEDEFEHSFFTIQAQVMRLLHTGIYELRTFLNDFPPYAILSHTWANEEVTFEHIHNAESRTKLKGWTKIAESCKRAREEGWHWIWVDTCCINKADSTELGEAINSMFTYYESANICYAYLADVPPKYELGGRGHEAREASQEENGIPWAWHFRSSRWFTRGWTLQELLAPKFLIFLDDHWNDIGQREHMADEIEKATRISTRCLWDFRSSSVATKMSWAAGRQTSREEDLAYSLLGLFGINMPLIYGEGRNAFLRLQKELIHNQNDESILAWGLEPRSGNAFLGTADPIGVLAQSPEDFTYASDVVPWPFDPVRNTFSVTNVGITLNAELFMESFHGPSAAGPPMYAILLNCRSRWPPLESMASPVVLMLTAKPHEANTYTRMNRYFKAWREMSGIRWETLGRQQIYVAFGSTAEPSRSKINFMIHCPHELQVLHGTKRAIDDGPHHQSDSPKGEAEIGERRKFQLVVDCLDGSGRLASHTHTCRLRPGQLCFHWVTLTDTHPRNRSHIWMAIKASEHLPHVGVWKRVHSESMAQKVAASMPAHAWPSTVVLPHRGIILELFVRPMPTRDSGHGHDRQYHLKARWRERPDLCGGAIGRYVTDLDGTRSKSPEPPHNS